MWALTIGYVENVEVFSNDVINTRPSRPPPVIILQRQTIGSAFAPSDSCL